jgi:integrase
MSGKKVKTKTPGVRYREHPTRKHGVRRDRYYFIRYKLDGKDKEEGLGWESQGWTERKAAIRLNELRENKLTGVGARTLAEKRKIASDKAKREKEEEAKKKKESATFSEVFEQYAKQSQLDKNAKTCEIEKHIFKKWLSPLLGHMPMKDISPFALEKLKKQMKYAGAAAGTIARDFAVVSQIINYAKAHDLYDGENPTAKVKKPTEDNRRSRFLSQEEAEALLEELSKASSSLRDMALLSLHCGLRAGEIFNLTWSDVDLRNGSILIKDTKSGRNRNAVMTSDVKAMLELRARSRGVDSDIVFPSRTGGKTTEVSRAYDRAVERLGFNKGVKDRRQRVVFHTLRHTYASWLVMSGVDLYTVQKLMGHSTMAMTERYSHLAPDHLKKAVSMLEESMKKQKREQEKSAVVNIVDFKDVANASTRRNNRDAVL